MSLIRGALSSAFASAAQSRPGQFFIRHAGKISGASFALGDVILIGKDYLQSGRVPDGVEQVSGLIFLLVDGLLALMDRYPAMKFPAGVTCLAGAAVLGYSGMGDAGQNQQLFGCAIITGQALALMFENGLQNFASGMERSGSAALRTLFRPLAQYPVLTTTAMDIVLSKGAIAWAAILKRDAGLFIGSMLWILGDIGIIGSDSNIKALLKDEDKSTVPAQPRPA